MGVVRLATKLASWHVSPSDVKQTVFTQRRFKKNI